MKNVDCSEIEIDEHGAVHLCGECAGCLRKKLAAAQERLKQVEQERDAWKGRANNA